MGKKNKGKKGGAGQKKPQSKTNVFKVAKKTAKSKKTKEIPKKLKQIDIRNKQERADEKLKDLHLKMVTKPAVKEAPKKAKKAPVGSTKAVEADLNKMQV